MRKAAADLFTARFESASDSLRPRHMGFCEHLLIRPNLRVSAPPAKHAVITRALRSKSFGNAQQQVLSVGNLVSRRLLMPRPSRSALTRMDVPANRVVLHRRPVPPALQS
jgi:hypothetical protein